MKNNKPRYKVMCNLCKFMGQIDNYDIYWCRAHEADTSNLMAYCKDATTSGHFTNGRSVLARDFSNYTFDFKIKAILMAYYWNLNRET